MVIPENVRVALNLKPGIQIEVIAKGSIAYLVPVRPFEEIRKSLTGRLDMKQLREKKDRKL